MIKKVLWVNVVRWDF